MAPIDVVNRRPRSCLRMRDLDIGRERAPMTAPDTPASSAEPHARVRRGGLDARCARSGGCDVRAPRSDLQRRTKKR